jgi:hypothetical protein
VRRQVDKSLRARRVPLYVSAPSQTKRNCRERCLLHHYVLPAAEYADRHGCPAPISRQQARLAAFSTFE